MSMKGGVMGVEFDASGKVIGIGTEALGKPLWESLSPANRVVLEPLIRRIQSPNRQWGRV